MQKIILDLHKELIAFAVEVRSVDVDTRDFASMRLDIFIDERLP
ncbi:hypothetical protein [Limobrevibacterium gyesilva]|uniref:Uncharacterized protein n=1 Tax=Limobrevibacterium gyesilva TaxID=2991712 RepID=A0AA42CK67_9PROT|nr:hypothetical protein [Limobrevibacterium gyesilva]MCW3477530.1 hypothetical protein [Limobrevibacterium gyesilva]